MTRPHVVLASHEVAPLVSAGGVGRHVAYAAKLLAPVADVTVVVPSGLSALFDQLRTEGHPMLGEGVELRVAERDGSRDRFVSLFHADAAELAHAVADVVAERSVDVVEVDDYLGLGTVLTDAAATNWRGLGAPVLALRLHTTWEMTQVLNGMALTAADARWICALERRALRCADVLIAPGRAAGASYTRFYGAGSLAPIVDLPPAPSPIGPTAESLPLPAEHPGPVRLLYAGRLEERKGVRSLVEAVLTSDLDVELSLAGGDSGTASDGGSMREYLDGIRRGDRRVVFLGRLEPEELDAAYRRAQLVVLPSRFESFGYVLREALAHGRPALCTPAAGFVELMQDPRAGWLADGFDAAAIRRALQKIVANRDVLDGLLATGAPRDALLAQSTASTWADDFLRLARTPRTPRASAEPDAAKGTITAVILPGGKLKRTLDALAAQDGERVEVIVAVEQAGDVAGSLLELVDRLVICRPAEALARALDARSGTGPVLLMRAGESLVPTGAGRLRAALAAPLGPAFATAWSPGHEAEARPLGGPEARLVADFGVAASCALLTAEAAVIAERAGTDPVAWLVLGGAYGVVVPEELFGLPQRRSVAPATIAAGRALSAFAAGHELWAPPAAEALMTATGEDPPQDLA